MPLLIIVVIALVILSPLATIASLNLLFGLSIPVTFWTWLATLWLSGIVAGGAAQRK